MITGLVLLGSCGSPQDGDGISVVVSTSILGDIVEQIVGDEAEVEVLIPVGGSPHDFSPSAQQVAALSSADLVIVNGLGLEETLLDVAEAARADGVTVLEVGPQLDPLPLAGSDTLDPHVWLDPVRMMDAVELIASQLAVIDGAGDWLARAEAYRQELEALDADIVELVGSIPEDRRTLVTNHDSMGYFAQRYGLEVIGTVIPGGSTLAAPSAADLAELVTAVEESGTAAIFAETTEPDRLAQTVAAELDRPIVVVELYTGSLGTTGSGADSYLGMMRTNAELIASALTQEPG